MNLAFPQNTIFVDLVSTLSQSQTENQEIDIWKLVLDSKGVVLAVLILLVIFSLVSWFIIVYKVLALRKARRHTHQFLETFWASKRFDAISQAADQLKHSPISQMFKAGYTELYKIRNQAKTDTENPSAVPMAAQLGGLENIERALKRTQTAETTQLERLVPFLATTGSTAPFIGLFGTVWGIMNSFINIGVKGNASLNTVAPGIAEALIATAIGLLAAIPAVAAYNFFNERIRLLVSEMESFSNDFLNIIRRHFLN